MYRPYMGTARNEHTIENLVFLSCVAASCCLVVRDDRNSHSQARVAVVDGQTSVLAAGVHTRTDGRNG